MLTSDFDYHLPQDLIAQTPIEPRDSSRILVLDRESGLLQHKHFHQIFQYLRPGDVMVFNQSRVIPARLRGRRTDTGGKVEFLLLRRESQGVWQALAKPGRRLKAGATVTLETPGHDQSESTTATVDVEVLDSGQDGIKTIRVNRDEDIDRFGVMPLPPYIHDRLEDPERYQTVYSRQLGSAAAPTAGLHFTQELMSGLTEIGVEQTFVTLHVGLDTFRPVQDEDPNQHRIHTEYYELSQETADVLNRAKSNGQRIIAVGTTSVRVLEHTAQEMERQGRDRLVACQGQADIFILPGYRFRRVDAMITNFHLPRSTLLMLVSAFAGRETMLAAYEEAIRERYRFFSFGDAMLIL